MSNKFLTEALLQETYGKTHKASGYDPRSPLGFKAVLSDANAFKVYARTLAEGLDESSRRSFLRLARNTRVSLMENSMFQLNPHEVMTLPILRNFYPKLISKELVNVMPIDKPDVVKAFIKPKFRKMVGDATGASYSGYNYNFPEMSADISRGPQWGGVNDGVSTTKTANVGAATNILDAMGIDATMPAHLEKDFRIIGVMDSSNRITSVDFGTTVDGVFSVAVSLDNAAGDDVISGHVDFDNGVLYISSQTDVAKKVVYRAHAALEENSINPSVRFDMEKIRLTVVDRRISAEWTVNLEQDAKALFDISVQSELINIIGEQIALDIDKEIVTDLFQINAASNDSDHTATFYKLPPTAFTHGQKAWYENILIKLNELSATVYNDTYMGAANTIACNPLDAAIFEGINSFEYLGDAVAGGELGYRSATVASGKYKVLVSSVVPQGKMLVKYRSDDLARAAYLYAPYVPALLIPYPLGNNPTLTVMSRYATKSIRPNALSQLTISASQDPS